MSTNYVHGEGMKEKEAMLFFTSIYFNIPVDIRTGNQRRRSPMKSLMDTPNHNQLISFLKSVSGCQAAKFLIITNIDLLPRERAILPWNVEVVYVRWEKLVIRLEDFLGMKLDVLLQSKDFYKLTDFKPLIPALLPELFQNYEAFGWMDNDVWLSHSFSKAITAKIQEFDQISFVSNSWGPMSVFKLKSYRDYIVPELKQNARILSHIFSSEGSFSFDEWGHIAPAGRTPSYTNSFASIMQSIYVKHPRDFTVISVDKVVASIPGEYQWLQWDGHCMPASVQNDYMKIHNQDLCGYCDMMVTEDSAMTELRDQFGKSIGMCHYQSMKSKEWLLYKYEPSYKALRTSDVKNFNRFEASYRLGIRVHRNASSIQTGVNSFERPRHIDGVQVMRQIMYSPPTEGSPATDNSNINSNSNNSNNNIPDAASSMLTNVTSNSMSGQIVFRLPAFLMAPNSHEVYAVIDIVSALLGICCCAICCILIGRYQIAKQVIESNQKARSK